MPNINCITCWYEQCILATKTTFINVNYHLRHNHSVHFLPSVFLCCWFDDVVAGWQLERHPVCKNDLTPAVPEVFLCGAIWYLVGWDGLDMLNEKITSCRREAATICSHPGLQVATQYTSYTHLDALLTRCPCWPASTANQSDLDLWPFDLESVQVTCDMGYVCANFSLPRPLCSRFRPDVRDR